MLLLSRKVGESVVLPGYGVTMTVVHVGKSRVQLGITAPKQIAVRRREVLLKNRHRGVRKDAMTTAAAPSAAIRGASHTSPAQARD